MIRSWRSCRVVFDGQSRVVAPGFWTGNIFLGWSWARLIMLGRGIPAYLVGVSGQSFTWLAANWAGRADVYITPAGHPEPTIYVLCGGHSDYGGGDTGAQAYADAGTLAQLARDAGAQYVICTTTLPSTAISGTNETNRQAGNALVLSDPDGHFDASVDLEVPGLDDPTDTGSYFDGVHIYGFPAIYGITDQNKGTPRVASLVTPALEAAIAAVTAP